MNFFKRGLTSLVRKPGKSLILLLLIFVLCNVIAGAVSVKSALANTEDAMLGSMGVEVNIVMDYDNWDKLFSDEFESGTFTMPVITPDIIEKIGMSEYVRFYDYSFDVWYGALGLSEYYADNMGGDIGIWKEAGVDEEQVNAYFRLTGGQNADLSAVRDGDITISEGRTYTAEEIKSGAKVLLVSDKVAALNGLTVGSTVKFRETIYEPYDYPIMYEKYDAAISSEIPVVEPGGFGVSEPYEPKKYKDVDFEFTVIGIFTATPVKVTDKDGKVTEQDSPLINRMYTNNTALNECEATLSAEYAAAGHDSERYSEISSFFVLKSPDEVELFESQNKQYLPRGFIFTNNASSFESIQTPLSNVEWIADIVMWVAVGATVLIISLLVTLFLRDRKHEMGIYLALGERKGTIAAQILTEVLIVALIAVSLSVFSGNVIAGKMSTTMLENQLAEEQKNKIDNDYSYGSSGIWIGDYFGEVVDDDTMSSEEIMELYDVKLDIKTVLFIYVVGMGSVLVSTLVPIMYTLRLKPKKILM